MISCLKGDVLFQGDGFVYIMTNSGVGYKVHWNSGKINTSTESFFFTSHIIRENSEDLYGFNSLKEKMLFELLNSVKGVGPKSAFSLVASLGFEQTIGAITLENKKLLTNAPGIGNKAASQIILDLQNKLGELQSLRTSNESLEQANLDLSEEENINSKSKIEAFETNSQFLQDTIMACKDLGFKEDVVLSIANNIIHERKVKSSEELLHLVLKGL